MGGWNDETARVLANALKAFGRDVTYTPAAGEPRTIKAIFESSFQSVDHTGAVVTTQRPVLGVRLGDLAAAPGKGDRVTVGSTTYAVVQSQIDGEGGAKLILSKV